MHYKRNLRFPYYHDADDKLFETARELRKEPTTAEKLLWEILRGKNVKGCKFRRQHPIGYYVADFYCHKAKLVVEADGDIHDAPHMELRDARRDYFMKKRGLKVLRFTNEAILFNAHVVVAEIEKYLK